VVLNKEANRTFSHSPPNLL